MRRGGPIERKTPMKRTRIAAGRKPGRTPNPPRKHRAAKRKGLRRPAMDKTLRAEVYQRAGALCDRHGGFIHPEAWECHHRQLRSRGGQDTHENLVALCSDCHAWVHANPAAATRDGWQVPSWADPAEVPVLRHGRAWMLPAADWRPTRTPDTREQGAGA